MPVHVGNACQCCERVFFIARTDRIEFLAESSEYQLLCSPPCGVKRRFDTRRMAPYSASMYLQQRRHESRRVRIPKDAKSGFQFVPDGHCDPRLVHIGGLLNFS